MTEPETTEDRLLAGEIVIYQPRDGFRAGTDSLLLAGALPKIPGGAFLEIGTGCGGALLPAAWRLSETGFQGLEIDPAMVGLAQRGIEANGFHPRVEIETGEASHWVRSRENQYDCVFSNPPYFAPGTIKAPGEGRKDAYIETIALDAWLKAMVFAAKPRAPIVLIHRAAELARILAGLDKWAGEITVLPIAPFAGEEANRVLVRARKGLKRGRMRLLAPLIVRDETGERGFSARMRAIQRGDSLDWA